MFSEKFFQDRRPCAFHRADRGHSYPAVVLLKNEHHGRPYRLLHDHSAGHRDAERPLVPNAHFAEQRSPGFSLLSLVPYAILTGLVEPFVKTEIVPDTANPQDLRPPKQGSEMMSIPSVPIRAGDLLFKDYRVGFSTVFSNGRSRFPCS